MNIKPVENNKSKGKTYTALIHNYNSAMANGYYGEAELIVYAFLEDRLRSFLYYSNALDSRNSRTINDDMQSICGRVDSINNITTKMDIIRKAFKNGYLRFDDLKTKSAILDIIGVDLYN